ncbi:MAG: enoyl-CoA hydratase-related protein [Dehalococcoidia bacterium]|nr:enoyl-CoA hydratase-related protein [Dehalococcoidia bacterium]
MPVFDQILYEQEGRILTITLNRPERLNAWTPTMEREFIEALNAANADDSIGVIVVTGAGRGFCAGADITGWAAEQQESREDHFPALATTVEQEASPNIPLTLANSKPVIAAINGPAIGIGLTLSLACDIRVAADTARFSARFVRVGLLPESGRSPAPGGIENSPSRLVLTGHHQCHLSAAQKLVSRIVPADQVLTTAYQLAAEIAEGPTKPVWLAKKVVRRNASEPNLHDVVANETQLFVQVKHKPDHREAVTAFLEKREPNWHG